MLNCWYGINLVSNYLLGGNKPTKSLPTFTSCHFQFQDLAFRNEWLLLSGFIVGWPMISIRLVVDTSGLSFIIVPIFLFWWSIVLLKLLLLTSRVHVFRLGQEDTEPTAMPLWATSLYRIFIRNHFGDMNPSTILQSSSWNTSILLIEGFETSGVPKEDMRNQEVQHVSIGISTTQISGPKSLREQVSQPEAQKMVCLALMWNTIW